MLGYKHINCPLTPVSYKFEVEGWNSRLTLLGFGRRSLEGNLHSSSVADTHPPLGTCLPSAYAEGPSLLNLVLMAPQVPLPDLKGKCCSFILLSF